MLPVKTSKYMNKYEFARVVGLRALQLSSDAQIPRDHANISCEEMATKDVLAGKLKWKIRRYLPDGSYEDCDIRELKIDDGNLYVTDAKSGLTT